MDRRRVTARISNRLDHLARAVIVDIGDRYGCTSIGQPLSDRPTDPLRRP